MKAPCSQRNGETASRRDGARLVWLLTILCGLPMVSVSAFGQTNTVTCQLRDFTSDPVAARSVLIAPRSLVNAAGTIATYDRRAVTTDAAGQFALTNMVPGTYTVTVQGPPNTTTFTVLVGSAPGSFNLRDLLVVDPAATSPPDSVAWSTTVSDARYAPIGGAGGTNVVFAGSVGVTTLAGYSSINVDGAYRGLTWDTYGFTLGDYNAAGQLYIDDTTANFGGGLTVNGTLFSGAFAGDATLLRNVPPTRTPSFGSPLTAQSLTAYGTGWLQPQVTTVYPHGNGWGSGDSPNCAPSQSPPYVTLTNWYSPTLTNWNLAYVAPGTGWWLAESNFLQHPYLSTTGLCIFITGGIVGTDDGRVSNIWAHAWNTNNLYLVESLQTSLQTNGTPGLANDTAWNTLMAATYGNHFLRVNAYLQAKTNGTALDAQYVASGVLPFSLYCTNGTTGGNYAHLNATGYGYMGEAIAIGVSNSVFGGVVGNAAWLTNLPQPTLPMSWRNDEFGTVMTIEMFGVTEPDRIIITNSQTGQFAMMRNNGFTGDGFKLSNLNPTNLGSAIPLSKLSGITSNQIDAATWTLMTNAVAIGGVTQGALDSSNYVSRVVLAGSNYLTAALAATQMAGSNYLSAAQVASQIAGSNLVTAAQVATQVAGSNYISSARLGGSNYLNATLAASQIASSNLLTAAQVATQIAGSNLLTAAQVATQVAGSNYLTAALVGTQVGGSNYVKQSFLDGSNFVSTTTLAGSNFISSVRLAGSNYCDFSTLGSSNYLKSLTGNAVAATNVQATNITANTAAWSGPTNILTMTGGDQYYSASLNCSISNASLNGWTTLWVSNASGGNITIYGPAGRYIGPGSTNALVVPAAHVGVLSLRVLNLMTNVATAAEQ